MSNQTIHFCVMIFLSTRKLWDAVQSYVWQNYDNWKDLMAVEAHMQNTLDSVFAKRVLTVVVNHR